MNGEQPPKRTIDERIDAMALTMELLQSESLATTRKVDKLVTVVETHEKEINRFHRAMRAALEAWLSENGDERGEKS